MLICRCLVVVLFLVFGFSVEGNAFQDALQHIETGNVHAKNGDLHQSLASLNAAITKDPGNARAYKLRGHVYYAMGDYQRALTDLDHVVALVPNHANAFVDRAIVQSVLGHHGLALADVERALALKPNSAFAQAVREKILENAAK